MKFYTLPHKKQNTTSKTPELSLIADGFYNFYHFCSHPDQIFKNKNCCKNFYLVVATSNKVYFRASMKASNIL